MQYFTVLPEHLTLLKSANVSWHHCEFGAPAIDCKRPYGNSSVFSDIGRMLGIVPDQNGYFTDEQEAYMLKIHEETQTVLQIFLSTGKMEAGKYQCENYYRNWTKV